MSNYSLSDLMRCHQFDHAVVVVDLVRDLKNAFSATPSAPSLKVSFFAQDGDYEVRVEGIGSNEAKLAILQASRFQLYLNAFLSAILIPSHDCEPGDVPSTVDLYNGSLVIELERTRLPDIKSSDQMLWSGDIAPSVEFAINAMESGLMTVTASMQPCDDHRQQARGLPRQA